MVGIPILLLQNAANDLIFQGTYTFVHLTNAFLYFWTCKDCHLYHLRNYKREAISFPYLFEGVKLKGRDS